ncbi:MAG: TonB-dependent receptor [Gammaproteobacteria bacterium]|nr:TonB-dependent receptor [Gammaproteobacteria bacterium]
MTARRREEQLQDVPLAITVRSQEELTRENIQSIGDLQHSVPSLTMYGPFRNTPIVSIRGQGGFTPGGIPSVVMYLNEIPLATSAQAGSPGGALGGNGLFYDLENVQVLKGPQGTLFGRNTTGGAILVQSRRPDDEFAGYLTTTVGDFDDREIDAALNVPLSATSAFRLAINGQERDGFTDVKATPSRPNGIDLDDEEHFSVRGSLQFKIGPAFENLLIADYMRSETNGTSAILKAVNANPLHPVNRFFPDAAQLVAVQDSLGIRDQVPLDVDMSSKFKRWSLTDTATYEVSDTLTVRNIASYSYARYAQTIDGDGTVFPIFEPIADQEEPYVTRQYTEELQLQGNSFDGVLDWTAGFFYLNQPEEDDFTLHTNRVFGAVRYIGFKQFERSTAVFLQGDLDLSSWAEGLSATAGVRYTWERIGRSNRDVRATGVCTSPYSSADCVLSDAESFDAPTWTIGLNYELTPDSLVYIASRRGFRSGGFNLVGDGLPQDQVYDQEYVTDIEIGGKARWNLGDAMLTTNLALYRQYYRDAQLSQSSVSAISGGPLSVTKNAGRAVIDGVEFEGTLSLGEGFELTSHFAYIDYDFEHLNPGVVLPVHITNIPHYKYGIGANYELPLTRELGQLSFSMNWNWQDDVYLTTIVDPYAIQEDYGLLSLGASWRNLAGRPIDLSFFMNNATDEEYAIGALPLTASVGVATVAYGAPRMWGVRLGYRFGADR